MYMICKHKSTKSNSSKYCYVSLTIQFKISHLFALSLNVKQFYRTPSDANTPGQSGPGSDGNEGVLCIPQRSNNTSKQSYSQVTILNTYNLQLYGIKYSYRIQIIFKQT